MNALVKRMTAAAAAAVICISSGAVNVIALNSDTIIIPSYNNEAAGSTCIKTGISGSYTADTKAAVDRINEIRLEACQKGYPDPNNPSKKLTKSDYVPIKWSASLEKEARTRAAEASVRIDHTRPNDENPFSLVADDVWDSSEVLAWNWSNTIVSGVEQFYAEKNDWVNQNSNAVTGHYESMIDPDNTYVGMSAFQPDSGTYGNTVAGRFGQSSEKVDESSGKNVPSCVSTVVIKKSYLSNPRLVKVSGASAIAVGKPARYELRATANIDGAKTDLVLYDGIKWTTSAPLVATVDRYGKITAKGAGKVTITATCGTYKASRTFTVTGTAVKVSLSKAYVNLNSGSTYAYTGKALKPAVTVKLDGKTLKKDTDYTVTYRNNVKTGKASCTVTGKGGYTGSKTVYFYIKPKKQTLTKVTKPAKGQLAVYWKKDPQSDGVQIFYALKSNFTDKKWAYVKGNTKSRKTFTGLKSKKNYYIKLRSYKTVDGRKIYGTCSKTVRVTTK